MTDIHSCSYYCDRPKCIKAQRDELRDKLAEPEQEPLEYWNAVEGWVKIDEVREHFDSVGCGTIYKTAGEGRVPLTAAQRTWVGLTDDEIWELWETHTEQPFPELYVDFKRAFKVIEAKLKEKNDR
jgi:hypothetical protein